MHGNVWLERWGTLGGLGQVQFLVQRMAEIGDEAQNQRPDNAPMPRLRRLRMDGTVTAPHGYGALRVLSLALTYDARAEMRRVRRARGDQAPAQVDLDSRRNAERSGAKRFLCTLMRKNSPPRTQRQFLKDVAGASGTLGPSISWSGRCLA